MHTIPTGFAGVPPPGPAMPVTATAIVATLCARAPSAIAVAVCSDTAIGGAARDEPPEAIGPERALPSRTQSEGKGIVAGGSHAYRSTSTGFDA